MRILFATAVLVTLAAHAMAQGRYTTAAAAIICTTERGVTDGINLFAKGEREALSAVGCFYVGAGRDIVPIADGIMDPTLARVILKAAGNSAQGYIFKGSITDTTTGKTVHWSDKPGY